MPRRRDDQAAFAIPVSLLMPAAHFALRCASSRISVAAQIQLPQPAPQPVRMVNSAMLRQPASAVWRMVRSVTPLQRQTYMAVQRELGTVLINSWMRTIVNCGSAVMAMHSPPPITTPVHCRYAWLLDGDRGGATTVMELLRLAESPADPRPGAQMAQDDAVRRCRPAV